MAISYIIPYRRTHNPWAEIQEILADLKTLASHPDYVEAVKLHTGFFGAMRSPISYLFWLVLKAPKLRRNRAKVTELADLPLPRWQKTVLETLSYFEEWMPTLLPIKNHVVRELEKLKESKQEPIVVASLGCGGMELERQIIYQLIRKRFSFPAVFIGVDYSAASLDVATSKFQNLTSKGLVHMQTITHLGNNELAKIKAQAASQGFMVVSLRNDAFALKELAENSLDLVYHARLRHHLTTEEARKLDELANYLAPNLVELDDIFSIWAIIVMSIFIWRFPAILNGCILSCLRDYSKRELRLKRENGWHVDVSGRHLECYLGVREKTNSTET
jgi:SAM-dependent methyltransferase